MALRGTGGADALRRALSAAAAAAGSAPVAVASMAPVAAATAAVVAPPRPWWFDHQQQQQQERPSSSTRTFMTTTSTASTTETEPKPTGRTTKKTAKPAGAWRSRLPPGAARPGVLLRARDPARFERMRLVLGYYDPPSLLAGPGGDGSGKKSGIVGASGPPQPPRHATVSLLQTLWFTPDVDPYYKMALLSYRTRPLNRAVSASLPRAEALLSAVAEEAGAFVPGGSGAAVGAGAAKGGKGGGAAGSGP